MSHATFGLSQKSHTKALEGRKGDGLLSEVARSHVARYRLAAHGHDLTPAQRQTAMRFVERYRTDYKRRMLNEMRAKVGRRPIPSPCTDVTTR